MNKTFLSTLWRRVIVAYAIVGPLAVAGAFAGCDGPAHRATGANVADGGSGGGTTDTRSPASDASEPDVPTGVSFDGGVPLGELSTAWAIAQCNYLAKCASLAPYLVQGCIQALTTGNGWSTGTCQSRPGGTVCEAVRINSSFPRAAAEAVDMGLAGYDPDRASACLQALQAQSCHGTDLYVDIPPCAGMFWCAADGGTAEGGDGGTSCSDLHFPEALAIPCSSAGDCAEAGPNAGRYCLDGYCTSCPGDPVEGTFCTGSVGSAEPCDADPPFFGAGILATPWGTWSTRICSFGLTCRGLSFDGGLGACAAPVDIGGACVDGAAIAGCKVGLVCEGGGCAVPPSQGACVSGACKAGEAYCDLGTCYPVQSIGGSCSTFDECAPALTCDPSTRRCAP
jgi:hypothetical protein